MNIQMNGSMIVFEPRELDDVYNLKCVCGHKLSDHACPVFYAMPDPQHNTIYTSQCVVCGLTKDNKDFVCNKFRINK